MYAVVPLAIHNAIKSRHCPPQTDFALEPLRSKASPELLAPGTLGVDFEIVLATEFEAFYRLYKSELSGRPLLRKCVRVSGPSDKTLVCSVDLYPVYVTATLAGGSEMVGEGGAAQPAAPAPSYTFLSPKIATPTAVLADIAAGLGLKGVSHATARLWLVRAGAAAGAEAGAGAGAGAGPTRALLAGRRLDAFLNHEERLSSACSVEVEVRRKDGTWPSGDTSRAVRARALWCQQGAPPMTPQQFYALLPASKVLTAPLRTLCDVEAAPGVWAAGEVTKLPVYGGGGGASVSVIGESKAASAAPVVAAVGQEEAAAPQQRLAGLSLLDLAALCAAPLTRTQPWRSLLQIGAPAAVRLATLPSKGASAPQLREGRVVDLDFGCYPPVVTVELEAAAGAKAAAQPLRIQVGLESSSLCPSSRAAGPAAEPAAEPPAQLPLAHGALPALTARDCAALSAQGNASPFAGLVGEELEAAAGVALEEMEGRSGGSGAAARAPGVVGFQNIGNTCFMAATLQCLAAIEPLTAYFASPAALRDINSANDWGTGGRLALAWAALTRTVRCSAQGGAVTPALVKEILAEKYFVYAGFAQQDACEFAQNFLGVVSEDVLRSYPKYFNQEGVEGKGRAHGDVAEEAWSYHLRREDHIVNDVFGGQFHKVMTCTACGTESVKCDPFTSLDLPLPQSSSIKIITLPLTTCVQTLQLRVPTPPRAPPATLETTTVAEVAAWLHAHDQSGGRSAAYLSPELTAAARADPVGVLRASGWIAAAIDDCCFVRELGAAESVSCPSFTTLFYPTPAGRYVPLNMRVAWDDEQGKPPNQRALPRPFKHSNVCYEPYMLPVPEGSTQRSILDAVWAVSERFMSPQFREKYSAESPPYTVYATGGVRLPARAALPRGLPMLHAAATAQPALALAYTDAPFAHDARTCTLVLEAFRPKAEWSSLHEFPTALREGRKLLAFKDTQVHPAQENDQARVDIYKLLALNEAVELMDGNNEVYCSAPACKTHRAQSNKLRLWRLPPVLCITLKRFRQTQKFGYVYTEKIKDPVAFPVVGLDMAPFVAAPRAGVAAGAGAFAPSAGAEARAAAGPGGAGLPPLYDLCAVVNHSGELHGGHYTAHIQDYATGQWHFMDGAWRARSSVALSLSLLHSLPRAHPTHHTCCCHSPPPDTRVSAASPEDAITSKAYVLYYRLRGTEGEAVRAFNAAFAEKLKGCLD